MLGMIFLEGVFPKFLLGLRKANSREAPAPGTSFPKRIFDFQKGVLERPIRKKKYSRTDFSKRNYF